MNSFANSKYKHWVNMPSFDCKLSKLHTKKLTRVRVRLDSQSDADSFFEKLGANHTLKTKSYAFHEKRTKASDYVYSVNPPNEKPVSYTEYPFYILSKGRATAGSTTRALTKIGIQHYIIVEPQEYDEYNAAHGNNPLVELIILEQKFIDEFDPFDTGSADLGTGGVPARNFAWDHSTQNGFKRHWLFDDNISCFYRTNGNRRIPVGDDALFASLERFVDRYDNIPVAGLNYMTFVDDRNGVEPYEANWRVFSMLLIENSCKSLVSQHCDGEHGWRGRYNEDVDLSLRVLKSHKDKTGAIIKGKQMQCTVVSNFLCGDKAATMSIKGGNSDGIYKKGTDAKSQMIVDMHPGDCKKIDNFHGRIHHKCNYKPYEQNPFNKVRDTIADFDVKLWDVKSNSMVADPYI